MSCRKLLIFNAGALGAVFLLFAFSPFFLDINPQSYSVSLPDKFEKGLAYNERLSASEQLFENEIVGPESLALHKGAIYTGLHNGEIIKIQDDKKSTVVTKGKLGRPLGLRFDKNGLLYVADVLKGLLTVDVNTGKVTNFLPYGKEINGKKIAFPDDLDIDDNGVVYFSDATTHWDYHTFMQSVLEHDNSGRILAHDTKTGQTSVVMDNLYFPNGVQLTHDRKALLVVELLKLRILKYHLLGPKKGQTEVFANLPGEPDNIRLSKRGGYWVAMASCRNATSKNIFDHFSEYPLLRKVFSRSLHTVGSALEYASSNFWPSQEFKEFAQRIKTFSFGVKWIAKTALVVELNEKGEIAQSLHSSDPRWTFLSEVLEDNGFLYLGSFINPYLGKVKL